MSLLEVKNIKKNFGKVEVLKGIDFSLERGQVLAIIGSSGSGKTTLLRCLNFLETPDEGQIIVGDKVLFDGDNIAKTDDETIARLREYLARGGKLLCFGDGLVKDGKFLM